MDYSGHDYKQKGPRAHQFVAMISIAISISFFFESYTTYVFLTVFSIFNGLTPFMGQHVWAFLFAVFGIFLFIPHFMHLRGFVLALLSLVWMWFGLFALWASLIGPDAANFGSFTGIMSLAVSGVCLLGASNLKRDFHKGFFKKKVRELTPD